MGTWDWEGVENDIVALNRAPACAQLAAAIISQDMSSEEWARRVLEQSGLPQVGLVEWHLCDEVESIFELLRAEGSQIGYVVEQEAGRAAKEYARRISLSAATAEQIYRDLAMEFPMAFVDDQQLCLLASCFSDYALICLREDLFEKWLATRKLDLTLFADEEPYPVACDLKTAQALALRRSSSWRAHVRNTSAA
ncbi:MAG: hypothetical protein V2J14_10515 [Erythrobacter sp.]|jgi:hypothetical protein|nr:hypothetical protein [Erythrobacter sp.]